MHGMIDPVARTADGDLDLIARLHRIDGQVHGLVRLLGSGRPTIELLDLIAAVRGALLSVGVAMVARELDMCLHAARSGATTELDPDPCDAVHRLIRSA